jgi:hypothetical protein
LNARHADPLLMGLTHNLTRRSRLVKHGVESYKRSTLRWKWTLAQKAKD